MHDGGAPVLYYNVTVISDNGTYSIRPSHRPAVISGLQWYTQYVFNVSACNAVGCGLCGASNPVVPPGYAQPPGPVSHFTATSLVAAVQLAWQAPDHANVWPITVYTVWYSSGGNGTAFNVSGGNCTVVVSSLQPLVTYDFKVVAWNEAGEGQWSDGVPGMANVCVSLLCSIARRVQLYWR